MNMGILTISHSFQHSTCFRLGPMMFEHNALATDKAGVHYATFCPAASHGLSYGNKDTIVDPSCSGSGKCVCHSLNVSCSLVPSLPLSVSSSLLVLLSLSLPLSLSHQHWLFNFIRIPSLLPFFSNIIVHFQQESPKQASGLHAGNEDVVWQ